MTNEPLDLLRLDGTVGRGRYALVGVIGFAIKYHLDRFVAIYFFHRSWSVFHYLITPGQALSLGSLARQDAPFLLTMAAVALPFIYVGVAMTLRRLRDAGLPAWLVALFFVPAVNLIFFLILAALPSHQPSSAPASQPLTTPAPTWLDRLIPHHPLGSAAMAIAITSLLGAAATWLCTTLLGQYGWGLFVGLPFCVGLLAVLLHGYHQPRSFRDCLSLSVTSAMLFAWLLLVFAVEGAICLLMAAPIVLTLAALGGSVGYVMQRRPCCKPGLPLAMLAIIASIPTLMGAEFFAQPAAPLFAVRTSVDIDAPPERVWHHVIAFSKIPPPRDWLFRAGVAYPIRAEIRGHGVGAQRHCVFSTGSFVEPIEVWDEPRLLKFSVTHNPAPMQEWTPYADLHPPHLEGFFISDGGQFLLIPQPNGATRLEGTTWYRHHMWPATYWRWWADLVIHRIHLRVLRHIQALAEAGSAP